MPQNNLSNSKNSRWAYIDFLEFVGMLMVIIYHSATYQYSFVDNIGTVYYIRYFFNSFLTMGVPLFFFANGYLLFNRNFNLKKHIVKTVNIICLSVIWAIINILLTTIIEHEPFSLNAFVSELLTGSKHWINFLWYMGALVCIYVFFPILKVAFDSKKNIFIYFTVACAIFTLGNKLLVVCGTIFASALLNRQVDILDMNLFHMFNPFRELYGYSFVYFCIGGLAHQLTDKIKTFNAPKRNMLASLVIIISCTGLFITGVILTKITGVMWDTVWKGYDTIFALANVCALFVISLSYTDSNHNIANNFVFEVSCNTLGIYFIHMLWIRLTRPFVINLAVFQNCLGCIVYSLCMMILSLGIVLLIKKIPVVNLLVDLKVIEKKICK